MTVVEQKWNHCDSSQAVGLGIEPALLPVVSGTSDRRLKIGHTGTTRGGPGRGRTAGDQDGVCFITETKAVTTTWFSEEEKKRSRIDTWDGVLRR